MNIDQLCLTEVGGLPGLVYSLFPAISKCAFGWKTQHWNALISSKSSNLISETLCFKLWVYFNLKTSMRTKEGCAGQAQTPVNAYWRAEQSMSVTYGTCGLKSIHLGWHRGSNWAQTSCSGLWVSSILIKGWKLLFCLTSEYLFVLAKGLSFSWIPFWCSTMMYLLSPSTFFRYSQNSFCRSTVLRSLQVLVKTTDQKHLVSYAANTSLNSQKILENERYSMLSNSQNFPFVSCHIDAVICRETGRPQYKKTQILGADKNICLPGTYHIFVQSRLTCSDRCLSHDDKYWKENHSRGTHRLMFRKKMKATKYSLIYAFIMTGFQICYIVYVSPVYIL